MTRTEFGSLSAEDLALFTDLYELTMMQGYLEAGHDPTATFSLFFRKLPPDRGYVVAAGLEQAIHYLESLSFGDDALSYLDDLGFSSAFRTYLDGFEFTGDVRAVPEGTLVFPDEPLLEVTAPILEAQLFETILINQVGFQSLIATKAARMRDTVERHGADQSLVDFGSRRAHGTDAGMTAWVQSFPTEREAFEAFVDVYGEDSVLLVDTYDTVNGARTAMAVAESRGVDIAGVRLDSGDLTALSKEVAEIVGEAGIFVSSGMDEYGIESFLTNGGVATGFGPGTALVTSTDAPKLDAVYKLVAVEDDGERRPSMKLSPGKVTYPGPKSVRRVERDGSFERDVLARRDEDVEGEEQLVPVYEDGSLVYDLPTLEDAQARTRRQLRRLPDDVHRLREPATYPVEVSAELETLTDEVSEELTAMYLHGS